MRLDAELCYFCVPGLNKKKCLFYIQYSLQFKRFARMGVCDRVMLTPPQENAGIARTAGNQSTFLCVMWVDHVL
jgi:hypothetical protein